VPSILTNIKRIMFYEKATGGLRNYTLSALDQGWRVNHQQEVMVFGRIARKDLRHALIKQSIFPTVLSVTPKA